MPDSSQDHISQYPSEARKRGCLACSSKHCPDSLRVPIRVWRPAATLEALCRSPLMNTRGANPARVERVPEMSAVTRPKVVLARRPTAEWASDSGAGTSATAWRTLSIGLRSCTLRWRSNYPLGPPGAEEKPMKRQARRHQRVPRPSTKLGSRIALQIGEGKYGPHKIG